MYEERYNIPINRIVILISVDNDEPQVFEERRDIFVKQLMDENYKFVLSDSSNPEKAIALSDVVIFSDFNGYDTLFILKDIEGDEPVSIGTWMAVTLSSWGFGTAAGFVLTNAAIFGSIAMMAVSIGLNMLMSALSPTPEFSQIGRAHV